jgi:hypothetical protein
MMGEGGEHEVVIPLSQLPAITPHTGMDEERLAAAIVRALGRAPLQAVVQSRQAATALAPELYDGVRRREWSLTP